MLYDIDTIRIDDTHLLVKVIFNKHTPTAVVSDVTKQTKKTLENHSRGRYFLSVFPCFRDTKDVRITFKQDENVDVDIVKQFEEAMKVVLEK